MIKVQIPQLQGINFHLIPADFNTFSTATANVASQTSSGFFSDHILGIAQFYLLEGHPSSVDIQQRHL
jgi:hypothetical protein